MPQPWHALSADDALAALESTTGGLTPDDARGRLERYGPNQLKPAKTTSAAEILLTQVKSVVVLLLVAAMAVSLWFGDALEAIAIGVVLVLNTLLGFVIELRALRAMEALLQLDVPGAVVVRGGELRRIDARELVPGDIIEIERGRQVPADARFVQGDDVAVDEAPLTGESMPVEKHAEAILAGDTPLADRRNVVYQGTTVTSGVGRAVVFATGRETEIGRVGALISGVQVERTPLERRLDQLGRRLVWLTLGVAALVAGIGVWHGQPLDLVIETAIALAVAAVPEALPAVATIALAVGVHRMARRQALVRRLPAVEALGSTTVVCTDKTRTLTSGQMTATRVWVAGDAVDVGPGSAIGAGHPAARVLEAAALASRAQVAAGGATGVQEDAVDAAILAAADRAGVGRARALEARPFVHVIPFSSARQLMASFHRAGQDTMVYVKGAPRAVLALCARVHMPDGTVGLDDLQRDKLLEANAGLAREGLRVLAVAEGTVNGTTDAALSGLVFLGLIGLIDPPAPGVKETIARLRQAGLRIIMLTGDQRLTAEAIGRNLGMLDPGARVLDGPDLDRLASGELDRTIDEIGAFSRITPEHKLTIVRALQARGEIVAMFGDGVNDAAALKQADVGVAMGGRGTDIAKQAAAIVLRDDRFETIGAAVEEGRVIFENIRKFVFYLFSCNVAEVFVLLGAGLAGLPLPLLPLQLLWLNIVTDTFPALSLAMEPSEEDVMRRHPRRPGEAILSRGFLGSILFYGTLITGATLGAYIWALDAAPAQATTIAFTTLALAQTAHLGNARSAGDVLRPARAGANPFAIAGAALSVLLQVLAVTWPPLAAVLHVRPLSLGQWAVVVALALVPAATGQALKMFRPNLTR